MLLKMKLFLIVQIIIFSNKIIQGQICETSDIDKPCKTKNIHSGIVKIASECAIPKGVHPKQLECGFTTSGPLFCCPSDTPLTSRAKESNVDYNKIAREKCKSFGEKDRTVVYTDKILNGVDASLREFPHFAQIGYTINDDNEIVYLCGGVIISEKFVLTAAHCLNNRLKKVRLGKVAAVNGKRTEEDFNEETIIEVINKFLIKDGPQKYGTAPTVNDIALLKLKTKINFDNKFIHPACLATDDNNDIKNLQNITISGFGNFAAGKSKMAEWMLKATVVERPLDECKKIFEYEIKTKKIIISENQLCCSGYNSQLVDTCRGKFILKIS
jgi:hypothetical protein